MNRPKLRDFTRFLAIIMLLFSISGRKLAYSNHNSSVESKKIHYQKVSPSNSEEARFEGTKNTLLKIFAGIYNIQDDRFKNIYQGDRYIYGLGLSRKVYSSNQHNFFLSLDFRFYSKKGKSTVTKEDTKFILNPISMGGAYLLTTKVVFPFAEIGLDYFPYKEESVIHSTSGSVWGFHLQGGILVPLKFFKPLNAKIYLRYSTAKKIENDFTVNLGGIEFGLGIVYELDLFKYLTLSRSGRICKIR